MLGHRVEHHVAPPAIDLDERAEVVAPGAGVEVGGDEVLGDRRGAQVGALLAALHLVEDRRRRDRPAEPHPGRQDLGERAGVDHELVVERVERRQRVALVAQHPVRVVLHDQQLALARDPDQRVAALQRHRHPGGVLEGRHGVQEFRAPALALERVQRGLELTDPHPVVVEGDLHDLGLVGAERRDRARVRRRLGDDHVAGIDQRLAEEVDRLLAAGRDEQVRRSDPHVLGGHHLDDAVLDHLRAVGRPVLQRPRARLRRDLAHQRRVGIRRERRGVGQAAGQRDHVVALGERHQVPHR